MQFSAKLEDVGVFSEVTSASFRNHFMEFFVSHYFNWNIYSVLAYS